MGTNHNRLYHEKIVEPSPYSTYDNVISRDKDEKQTEKFLENTEPICILADKVYSHCGRKDCFPRFKVEIANKGEPLEFLDIIFQEGYIEADTLSITPIGPRRPNFSRVKFTMKIPFTIKLRNKVSNDVMSINGCLPDILKDMVLFIPEARNEFDFRIVIETRSEPLAIPEIIDGQMELPIGVFSITRVVGRVQLFIPAYSFIPDPPEEEKFEQFHEEMCYEFKSRPFPEDFFPPQFEDRDGMLEKLEKNR